MKLYLFGVAGGRTNAWHLDRPRLLIGRSSKADIQIADTTVSKEHAEIVSEGGLVLVRDLGSRNGTRVNGRPVGGDTTLNVGDRLDVGHVRLVVGDEEGAAAAVLSESPSLDSSLSIPANRILDRAEPSATETRTLFHMLMEAGRLLVLPRPLIETCDEILRIVERCVPASRLILLLEKEGSPEPVQMAARCRGGSSRDPLVLSRKIMANVLGDCTSVLTRDASADPRFLGQMSIVSQSVHSAMAVPLFDNERVLGLLYADSSDPTIQYDQEQLEILTLLANMAAVKITNARLLQAEQVRARLAQELATATAIQRGLLPAEPPQVEGCRLHVYLETCFEVGGDLYDFHLSPTGEITFLVGDVSGKGMGAALLMSSVMASARVLFDTCPDLAGLIGKLNTIIHQSTDSAHFLTAFLGRFDPKSGRLEYVNAGHPPPYVYHAGELTELEATGIPIGLIPGFAYGSRETNLPRGALLTLFTDGIPEARRGEDFFEEERLRRTLCEVGDSPDLEAVSRGVLAAVNAFVADDPRGDDITLLLLRRD